VLAIGLAAAAVAAGAAARHGPPPLTAGDHVLTLQWLQNGNGVGRATLSPDSDGRWHIEGHQEERYKGERNTLDLAGTIRVLNPRELEFTGTITTRVSYLNGGVPYERHGTFRMKAWGARTFWRMQGMTEPDGNDRVTDYIDLHFR